MRRDRWTLPKDAPTRTKEGKLYEGAPFWVELKRWPGMNGMFGSFKSSCCNCGMKHQETIAVTPPGKATGTWWMLNQTYIVNEGRPVRSPVRKRKKVGR